MCVAYRCQEEAPSGPLCSAHQKRLDEGHGLPSFGEVFPGDPSGHGIYGELTITELGLRCHECGREYVSLGQHTIRTHNLPAVEYRERHGLAAGQSLCLPRRPGDSELRRRPHPCLDCGTVLTVRAKICSSCWQHRDAQAAERRRPRLRWRPLTPAEVEQLRQSTDTELGELVRQLQADRVPSAVIGSILGHGPQWMTKRFPRSEYKREPDARG